MVPQLYSKFINKIGRNNLTNLSLVLLIEFQSISLNSVFCWIVVYKSMYLLVGGK